MALAVFLALSLQALAPAAAPPLARVEAVPLKAAGRPGASVTLAVSVTPRDGIHVYAPPQKRYIPISIAIDPIAGATVGKAQYPPSAARIFEGEKVRVYDKAFSIRVPLGLPPSDVPPAVTGTVTYQACDDLMCYRPVKVPVRWDLRLQ